MEILIVVARLYHKRNYCNAIKTNNWIYIKRNALMVLIGSLLPIFIRVNGAGARATRAITANELAKRAEGFE